MVCFNMFRYNVQPSFSFTEEGCTLNIPQGSLCVTKDDDGKYVLDEAVLDDGIELPVPYADSKHPGLLRPEDYTAATCFNFGEYYDRIIAERQRYGDEDKSIFFPTGLCTPENFEEDTWSAKGYKLAFSYEYCTISREQDGKLHVDEYAAQIVSFTIPYASSTHGGLITAEEKLKLAGLPDKMSLAETLGSKADVDDLPNVVAEEVADLQDGELTDFGFELPAGVTLEQLRRALLPRIVECTAIKKVLLPNTFYIWGEVEELNLSLDESDGGVLNEFMFEFVSGANPTVLNLPAGVKFAHPVDIESNTRYQVSIINNIGVIVGV